MFFKENKNFLSEENIKFIEDIVLSNNFPWYITTKTVPKVSHMKDTILAHVVLNRLEDVNIKDIINSNFYEQTVDILKNFLKSKKIDYNFFTRICYNFSYNNGYEKCATHKDHPYEHKQIIIYLNDCLDKEAKTIILDDQDKIIKEVVPEKYKGICFANERHFHYFPKTGIRIVLVATFI